jgi:hypothetical protein
VLSNIAAAVLFGGYLHIVSRNAQQGLLATA